MGEISATLCNYRDDVDKCCAATSGLGVPKHGGLTDLVAALQHLGIAPEQKLNGLTELEKAWVAGYIQGRRE